jgi:aminopeptidase N
LYLTQNKFKAAEVHHLRLAFEEVSGEDLNWFFNQWFLGKGHPILQVYQSENIENKQVTLNVVQKQKLDEYPLFQLPVDVQIIDENGKRTERINISRQNQDFTFSFSGKLINVLFDVNQVLLGNVYVDKPNTQFLNQYQLSNSYKLRAQALKYADRNSTNETQQLIVSALKDPFWHIRLLAVKASAKLTGSYLSDAVLQIKSIVINDPKSSVRSAALDFLSSQTEESVFVELCNKSINTDKSYAVLISALSNLSKIDKDLGLQKANDLAKEKTPKLLVAISAVFGDHGTESNFVFFENIFLMNKFQGFDELNVISGLLNLCLNTNARVIEKSYTIFDYLKKEGNSMTQMYYGQIIQYISNIIAQKIEAEMQKLEQTENAIEKQTINTEIQSLERLITVYEQLNQE